jgi:hypothetical protein
MTQRREAKEDKMSYNAAEEEKMPEFIGSISLMSGHHARSLWRHFEPEQLVDPGCLVCWPGLPLPAKVSKIIVYPNGDCFMMLETFSFDKLSDMLYVAGNLISEGWGGWSKLQSKPIPGRIAMITSGQFAGLIGVISSKGFSDKSKSYEVIFGESSRLFVWEDQLKVIGLEGSFAHN